MVKKKSRNQSSSQKQITNYRFIYLLLTVITFCVYANTISHQYTLDDAILITENSFTKEGLSGLFDIFSHDTFRGFFQEDGKDKLVVGGRYRPLSQAMFAIEYAFLGEQPWVGHLMNVISFAFLVCSIFFIISLVAQKLMDKSRALVFGFLAAVLFALHPVHTEVVANIKGRDEILVLLGGIWSLYYSLKYFQSSKIGDALRAAFIFFLALLAKENAIAFLAVIPATSFFFYSQQRNDLHRITFPLFLSFLVYLVIRFTVLGIDLGQEMPGELMNNPFLKLLDGQYVPMDFNEKYPLILYGLFKYIQLLIFPHPLTHDYYPKVFGDITWINPGVILAMLSILILLIASIAFFRKKPLVSFLIIFFVTTIFLTSNILFPVGTHMSERFLFTPSLAFCLALGAVIEQIQFRGHRVWAGALCILFLGPYFFKTIDRNRVWKDNFTLFTTDVETSSNSAKVQNAAGGVMIAHALTQTDTIERNQELQGAMKHLTRAIQIHPGYKNAFLLLGNAHFYLKEYERAINAYNRSLQLDPGYPEALYNRALAQRDFGRFFGEKQGNLPKAIDFLQKAYEQLQDDYETNRLLGIAYGNQGQPLKAIPFFEKALALKTDDAWTNYNLGLAYLAIQDSANANRYIGKAKTLNPEVGN